LPRPFGFCSGISPSIHRANGADKDADKDAAVDAVPGAGEDAPADAVVEAACDAGADAVDGADQIDVPSARPR
jgi:hypothetical protein